jgi:hypothetical protein
MPLESVSTPLESGLVSVVGFVSVTLTELDALSGVESESEPDSPVVESAFEWVSPRSGQATRRTEATSFGNAEIELECFML